MSTRTSHHRVSIGMPVYNASRRVGDALGSVLNQTCSDLEVIVCDNGSTDDTEQICREYARQDERVSYHRSPENRGLAWNYNRAFQLSSGRFFKWVPYDDVMAPTFLERCLAILEADPTVSIAISRVRLIEEDGTPADFDEQLREYIARRGLRRVPREDPMDLEAADPVKRYANIVRNKVWYYELYGLIRSDHLRRTNGLGAYVGSCQVLLAELALIGRFVQFPEELYFNRFPYFYASDPRSPELALKMDPHWAARVHFPQANAAFGYLRAARDSSLGAADRLRCWGIVARKVFEPDNLAKLVIPGPNNYLGLDVTKLWKARRAANRSDRAAR